MLSAAYALLGIEQRDGKIALRDDLFEAKGELRVKSLRIGDRNWTPDGNS
jgi:cyclic beta-1,2-glucan synthetase